MTDTKSKSPERVSIEALLGRPLPDGMVEDAAGLARAAQAAAQTAGAGLPFDARDPTGFTAVLESLGPDRGASLKARGVKPARPGAAKDNGRG